MAGTQNARFVSSSMIHFSFKVRQDELGIKEKSRLAPDSGAYRLALAAASLSIVRFFDHDHKLNIRPSIVHKIPKESERET